MGEAAKHSWQSAWHVQAALRKHGAGAGAGGNPSTS